MEILALGFPDAHALLTSPEQMAATLRAKYPQWVLEDLDWAELSRKMGDDD